MTVDEFTLPSGFCSSEHKTLNSPEVTLGRNPKELAEKGSTPGRIVAYVFVEGFIDLREGKKSGDVEVGSNVSERFLGNVEEWCFTLWERRGVVVLVTVSMLGSLKVGGIRVIFLNRSFSESFCGLVEHKLGGGEKHKLRSSTP
jgi:hypothetical protein